MRDRGIAVTLLFFECADEMLKRRFSESRRPHPMGGEGVSLEDAIRRERDALGALRELADRIIDTTRLTAHELRAFLKGSFGGGAAAQLNVHLMSFGFKYGLPAEADLVFDLRCLPNPYFVDHLRPLDGRAPEVRAFVEAQPEATELARRLDELLDFLIPLYDVEGKTYLTVALGCTGGKHRSVAFAEELGRRLGARAIAATVHHRDVGRE
jgi:UPF0042 nucleotide-binding protein